MQLEGPIREGDSLQWESGTERPHAKIEVIRTRTNTEGKEMVLVRGTGGDRWVERGHLREACRRA